MELEPRESPPEPSRRARKKQRTRREIYSAAMDLFAQRGFDAVTIEQICESADVARATFFLHFPTKAALLLEFNSAIANELADELCEPRRSARAEFEALVDRLAGRWLEQGDVLLAMLREWMCTPGAILQEAAAEPSPELAELLENIVVRGQARGEFRSDLDPRLVCASFFLNAAAILSGAVFREDTEPGEVRRQFLTLQLAGLERPAPQGGRSR